MVTLFQRVNHYIAANNKAEVSDEQRREIGLKVIAKLFEKKPPNFKVHHYEVTNEKGTFRVAHYPNFFIPQIDVIVRQELENHPEAPPPPPPIPERKPRRRIPAKIQY